MATSAPLATAQVVPDVMPGMMPPTLFAPRAATAPAPELEKSTQPPVARAKVPRFRMFPELTEIAVVPPALRLVVVKVLVAAVVRVKLNAPPLRLRTVAASEPVAVPLPRLSVPRLSVTAPTPVCAPVMANVPAETVVPPA